MQPEEKARIKGLKGYAATQCYILAYIHTSIDRKVYGKIGSRSTEFQAFAHKLFLIQGKAGGFWKDGTSLLFGKTHFGSCEELG